MKKRPAPTRPMKRAARTGDQLCNSAEPPTPRNSRVTVLQGRKREVNRLAGMQKIRLAMRTEEPSNPWVRGERSISLVMSGSRMPMMNMTLRDVPTQEVTDATSAQRRKRGLSIEVCNQARVGGVCSIGVEAVNSGLYSVWDGITRAGGRFPKTRSTVHGSLYSPRIVASVGGRGASAGRS